MDDNRIRNIFVKAGLEELGNLDRKLFGNKDPLKAGYAADFVKYMKLQ